MQSRVAVRLFLTCWFLFALHFATNTVREIYPALSLADHFSLDVSEYSGLHPDIFELPGRGTYINNNVGASILGAVPYFFLRPVVDRIVSGVQEQRARSGIEPREYESIYPMAREFFRKARARGLDVKFALAAAIMQALLMAPLSALATVVVFQILLRLGIDVRTAVWLAFLYAFATPVLYRTAQLNHNLLLSHAGLFAFAALYSATGHGVTAPRVRLALRFLLAGLFAGYGILLDYSGFVAAAAIGCYGLSVWWNDTNRSLTPPLALAGGIAAGIAALWFVQWQCFGHPLWPAQRYMPPTAYSGFGYRGMTAPDPELFLRLGFDLRYGLFVSAPFLLLALWPRVWTDHHARLLPRRETVFVFLFTAGFFLFTSCNQFARMQFNSGVRHVVPVVPFLFLPAAATLLRMPKYIAWPLAVVSTAWSWFLAMARDVEQGLGVVTAIATVLRTGPQLPWLTTLQRMGYVPDGPWAACIVLPAVAILAVAWRRYLEPSR